MLKFANDFIAAIKNYDLIHTMSKKIEVENALIQCAMSVAGRKNNNKVKSLKGGEKIARLLLLAQEEQDKHTKNVGDGIDDARRRQRLAIRTVSRLSNICTAYHYVSNCKDDSENNSFRRWLSMRNIN